MMYMYTKTERGTITVHQYLHWHSIKYHDSEVHVYYMHSFQGISFGFTNVFLSFACAGINNLILYFPGIVQF